MSVIVSKLVQTVLIGLSQTRMLALVEDILFVSIDRGRGKIMRRVFVFFLIVLFTSLLNAVPTEEEILSIAAEDAYNSFQSRQYEVFNEWNMDGWIRVVTTPKYQYFDNLPEELRNTYYYRLTLELNRLYFMELEESGDFDPMFYNKELLKTVQLLPISRDEIPDFFQNLMSNDHEFEKTVNDMRGVSLNSIGGEKMLTELTNILKKYEMELLPAEWKTEFWDELDFYFFEYYAEVYERELAKQKKSDDQILLVSGIIALFLIVFSVFIAIL